MNFRSVLWRDLAYSSRNGGEHHNMATEHNTGGLEPSTNEQ